MDSFKTFFSPTEYDTMKSFVGEWTMEFTHGEGIPSSKGFSAVNRRKQTWILNSIFFIGSKTSKNGILKDQSATLNDNWSFFIEWATHNIASKWITHHTPPFELNVAPIITLCMNKRAVITTFWRSQPFPFLFPPPIWGSLLHSLLSPSLPLLLLLLIF